MTTRGFFSYDGHQTERVIVREWKEDGPNKNCRLILELVNSAISRLYMENVDNPGVVLPLEKTNITVKSEHEESLSTWNGQIFLAYHGSYQVDCDKKCIFKLARKAVQQYECFV